MTHRRALQSTLQRLRGASATVKGLIVDGVGQGDAASQELVEVYWQLKDAEQALSAIARRAESGKRVG